MRKQQKLTISQKKTLSVLESSDGWCTYEFIQSRGGSGASLPKLIELGFALKTEVDNPATGYPVGAWMATSKSIVEFTNPFHAEVAIRSTFECDLVERLRVLVRMAGTLGEALECSAFSILMMAADFAVKQENNGIPLTVEEAIGKVSELAEMLGDGVMETH